MFDFSKMQSGMEVFFGNVDYSRAHHCNHYYQLMAKMVSPMAKPSCFDEVDVEALDAKLEAEPGAKIRDVERYFLLYRRALLPSPEISNSERLRYVRALARPFSADMELIFMLAQILVHADQYGEGMHYLERAVHLAPNHLYSWSQMTVIAALANDHGTTMRCARKALELGERKKTTIARAYVFSMLLMGMGSKTGYYSSFELLDNVKFEDIEDRDPAPEVKYRYEPENLAERPVVMFACNSPYFSKYGHHLIKSLTDISKEIIIHVHLVNASTEDLAWLDNYINICSDQVIVSFENQTAYHLTNPGYLTAVRFIHARDFIHRFERPYLIVDTDSLLNDAEKLISFLSQVEKPTFFLSEENPIWDRVSAPFVYLPHSPIGLTMASEVQNYLLRMFCTPTGTRAWYVDQLALSHVCLKYIDHVSLIPGNMLSCVHCSDDAIFWTLSNDKDIERYNAFAEQIDQKFPDL